MSNFLEELWDEATDFFEDFLDHLNRRPENVSKTKTTIVEGLEVKVRPAYLFAERIDNLLKIIFGFSVAVSAFTATFLGFSSLSQLIEVLTTSIPGRIAMFTIGLSYLVIAFWKLMHLEKK